jgi:hypothetical protein
MWLLRVVMLDILAGKVVQVRFTQRDELVEAF